MKLIIRILTGALALPILAAHTESPPNPHTILAEVDKIVSPNGIDESKAVEIGGIRQWITVRGRDRRNPILLVLHGGPAAPDLPNRYLFEGPWTDYFNVVEWDQRGSGKTYELNDPEKLAPTMHADRMVQDTEEARMDNRWRTRHRGQLFYDSRCVSNPSLRHLVLASEITSPTQRLTN